MRKYQINLKRIKNLAVSNNAALPWPQRHKSQNRSCWLTWAKPTSKCDFINYFWVAKAQLALKLVTTAAYQGKTYFGTAAGMRINHHGDIEAERFRLF